MLRRRSLGLEMKKETEIVLILILTLKVMLMAVEEVMVWSMDGRGANLHFWASFFAAGVVGGFYLRYIEKRAIANLYMADMVSPWIQVKLD